MIWYGQSLICQKFSFQLAAYKSAFIPCFLFYKYREISKKNEHENSVEEKRRSFEKQTQIYFRDLHATWKTWTIKVKNSSDWMSTSNLSLYSGKNTAVGMKLAAIPHVLLSKSTTIWLHLPTILTWFYSLKKLHYPHPFHSQDWNLPSHANIFHSKRLAIF